MNVSTAFETLAIALGLGLLVGMQRERVHAPLAGVRTFAILTVFGAIAGMLAMTLGVWVIVAGLFGIALFAAAGQFNLPPENRRDIGLTTEIAMLLMFAIGAYLVFGHRQVAVVLGASVAVLLHFKPAMRGWVERLGDQDMHGIMQFVLISLVVLPVLPNETYGPLGVLNPREIWTMVVLVVGISLIGYTAFKLFGDEAGIVLTGLLGGLISSTATTVNVARRASSATGQAEGAILIVLLASTVLHARVLIEVLVAAGQAARTIVPPIAVLLGVSILLSVLFWLRNRKSRMEAPAQHNPTELKSALIFGGLYAVVLLALAAARQWFGNSGIYVAAGLSGLTDMDAITLSSSRMAAGGGLDPSVAWRAITIASMANLVFKNVMIATLGGGELARRVALFFGMQMAAALALILVWPG